MLKRKAVDRIVRIVYGQSNGHETTVKKVHGYYAIAINTDTTCELDFMDKQLFKIITKVQEQFPDVEFEVESSLGEVLLIIM